MATDDYINYEIRNRTIPDLMRAVLLHLKHNDAAGWWSYRNAILKAMVGTRPNNERPLIHLPGDPRLN